MASVSEKNGNSVSGGKPERGGLTGSGTGLEPKPIRVSVIDDDPMICQAMSLILNDYSHGRIEVVSTSTDGETCVRRAAEEKPDVVLMDILLPGMNGLQVLTQLRQTHALPVILMSALGAEADRISGFQLGADDYLPKPFSMAELRVRIQARDVSLALDKPQASSILNVFRATVSAIAATDTPGQVLVQLYVGATPLLARITGRSRRVLDLEVGRGVWAQVKAVALLA